MNRPSIATSLRARTLVLCTLLAWVCPAIAEKADKQKPTQIEANRMTSDDVKRLSIFEGGVVLKKGTIAIRADRIVVRQDADGFQHASATGRPVHFRQRTDAKSDKPAVWIDGEAKRIELDDRNERIELFEQARVNRDRDEVRGNYIVLDQRAETFSVSGDKKNPGAGRVRAVIQPKSSPAGNATLPSGDVMKNPANTPRQGK